MEGGGWGLGIRVTGFGVRNLDCRFSNFDFRISIFQIPISDFHFPFLACSSPVTHHSPLPRPDFRISIFEFRFPVLAAGLIAIEIIVLQKSISHITYIVIHPPKAQFMASEIARVSQVSQLSQFHPKLNK